MSHKHLRMGLGAAWIESTFSYLCHISLNSFVDLTKNNGGATTSPYEKGALVYSVSKYKIHGIEKNQSGKVYPQCLYHPAACSAVTV